VEAGARLVERLANMGILAEISKKLQSRKYVFVTVWAS